MGDKAAKITVCASAKCAFCGDLALSGTDTCLRHAAYIAEKRNYEHPREKFLYMGVLPFRQRKYWADGKGRRHDG